MNRTFYLLLIWKETNVCLLFFISSWKNLLKCLFPPLANTIKLEMLDSRAQVTSFDMVSSSLQPVTEWFQKKSKSIKSMLVPGLIAERYWPGDRSHFGGREEGVVALEKRNTGTTPGFQPALPCFVFARPWQGVGWLGGLTKMRRLKALGQVSSRATPQPVLWWDFSHGKPLVRSGNSAQERWLHCKPGREAGTFEALPRSLVPGPQTGVSQMWRG